MGKGTWVKGHISQPMLIVATVAMLWGHGQASPLEGKKKTRRQHLSLYSFLPSLSEIRWQKGNSPVQSSCNWPSPTQVQQINKNQGHLSQVIVFICCNQDTEKVTKIVTVTDYPEGRLSNFLSDKMTQKNFQRREDYNCSFPMMSTSYAKRIYYSETTKKKINLCQECQTLVFF